MAEQHANETPLQYSMTLRHMHQQAKCVTRANAFLQNIRTELLAVKQCGTALVANLKKVIKLLGVLKHQIKESFCSL